MGDSKCSPNTMAYTFIYSTSYTNYAFWDCKTVAAQRCIFPFLQRGGWEAPWPSRWPSDLAVNTVQLPPRERVYGGDVRHVR